MAYRLFDYFYNTIFLFGSPFRQRTYTTNGFEIWKQKTNKKKKKYRKNHKKSHSTARGRGRVRRVRPVSRRAGNSFFFFFYEIRRSNRKNKRRCCLSTIDFSGDRYPRRTTPGVRRVCVCVLDRDAKRIQLFSGRLLRMSARSKSDGNIVLGGFSGREKERGKNKKRIIRET